MKFKIKKGSHYCNKWWLPLFVFRKSIKGTFKFSGDVSYKIEKQKDTNKLIGLSDSWNHHKDSIRIGWRYLDGVIEIMYIVYFKGERYIGTITEVLPEMENTFSVNIGKDFYTIEVNGIVYFFSRHSRWNFLRSILKPYFGGTTKAPRDFNIEVKL